MRNGSIGQRQIQPCERGAEKTLLRDLNRARTRPGEHDEILGIDKLDKIIDIDQSPIGRTPRSNPATYTGLFDLIRDVFAQTPDAKMRGYTNGRFSFNVKGGRCEACRGDGILKIEMHFCPIYTFRARFAAASDTTGKRLR